MFGYRSEMIIKLFCYLFSDINSHIITILDTVYRFIVFLDILIISLIPSQVLNKFNLFSLKNLFK